MSHTITMADGQSLFFAGMSLDAAIARVARYLNPRDIVSIETV